MTVFVLCMLSCFSHVWLCAALWTVAHQALLSMGFSRQEYCSGLPSPSPGDLPDPGITPMSPALAGGFFTTSATWEAHLCTVTLVKSRWICPLQLTFLGNLHEYGRLDFPKMVMETYSVLRVLRECCHSSEEAVNCPSPLVRVGLCNCLNE